MHAIKLYKIGELSDGTKRYQSQLKLGTDTADFVMENDGIMKHYDYQDSVFGFYPYEKPYEIVENINGMKYQEL